MSDSTTKPALPVDAYYHSARRVYLVQDDDGNWINIDAMSLKHRLNMLGYPSKRAEGSVISPADACILRIQQERSVTYVGPLAGYQRGLHVMSGYKVLVTHSPVFIESKEGNSDMLRGIIYRFFDDPINPGQADYYLTWLRQGIVALRSGKIGYGQALILCGPRGCGKSLLQEIFTHLLGGRVAKPYRYMMGKTTFNRDLFTAEHQMIEDEQPSTDPRVRLSFGSAIKIVTATNEHSCHGKGIEAITLRPFWRLTISVNDEPQNLMMLPMLEESILDKLIILRANKHPMPMPTRTPDEKYAFWRAIEDQLPAFLHWLLNVYEIPEHVKTDRYDVKPYINPHIALAINNLAPNTRLLSLIDLVFWTEKGFKDEWVGTAEEAENILHNSGYNVETNRLLTWPFAAGTYLGELAASRPERVESARQGDKRRWRIFAPKTVDSRPKVTPLPLDVIAKEVTDDAA